MASKFTKAKSEQAFFKAGLFGATGSGKTFTALLWAEGLAAKEGKRIAYIDTERGTDFYAMDIPERAIHPKAFDFDRLVTRSIMETIEAFESINPDEYGVVVIDSMTHLWEAVKNAYNGKLMTNGGIPVQAWGGIKKPYKKLMTQFLDGKFHGILCGREGVVMEDDEDGETKVIGHKMKAEGETAYEPHILGRMVPDRDKQGGYIINVFFEKDRSGILTGKEISWPTYSTIQPIVAYLSGDVQGTVGSLEEAAEKDAAAQERQAEREAQEKQTIYEQIRTAILTAQTVDALSAAWSLTKGKKTKLGDELFGNLTTAKDTRKNELMGKVGEVA
jgi:hypothetical protein